MDLVNGARMEGHAYPPVESCILTCSLVAVPYVIDGGCVACHAGIRSCTKNRLCKDQENAMDRQSISQSVTRMRMKLQDLK
jgi:hypothetical protein